jgi:hypothetical protein
MKKFGLVLAGTACAVGSLLCGVLASRPPAAAAPTGLLAALDAIDCGEMRQQEQRAVAFHIHNPLDETVVITDVRSSCACTAAKVEDRELPPGGTTRVTADLRSGHARGELTAYLDVLYRRDSLTELRRLPLRVTASVKPHYAVTPAKVVFRAGGSQVQQASVTLTPAMPPGVKVLEALSDNPAVRVGEIARDPVSQSTTIHLLFDPARNLVEPFSATMVLLTDSKLEPRHRVPVSAAPDERR